MKDSFVKDLQNNPIFQLSLSSKELFHSNFLAWLAEDKNTRPLFDKLMQVWLDDPDWKFNDEEMMVKREYKNFDFCICEKVRNYHTDKEKDEEQENQYIPGAIILVLENKFKSLPYKEQLQKYHEKVILLNIQGLKDKEKAREKKSRLENNWVKNNKELIDAQNNKTRYVLLTLANDIIDNTNEENSQNHSFTTSKTVTSGKTAFTNNADWKIINYRQYSEELSLLNAQNELWDSVENKGFYQELINHYCKFIDTFSSKVISCLKEIQMSDSWEVLNKEQFREVRCHDVWQKLVMHKCALEIRKMLEKEGLMVTVVSSDEDILKEQKTEAQNNIFILVSYYHGEGMLELKYILPGKGLFTLQQQGVHPLRTGILDATKTKSKYPKEKKHMREWNEYVEGFINKTCKLGDMISPKVVNKETEALYNSYEIFYYNDLNDKIKPIGDTLQDMIDKIKEVRDRKLKGK